MDGIVDATTAAVKEPYNINYNIYPQNKGMYYVVWLHRLNRI